MQSTLPLPVSHPVRALQGLSKQMALPHEYAPLRFPSFPALERTALMGFTVPGTVPLSASQSTKILVARQAAYPVWAEVDNVSSAYGLAYCSEGVQSGSTTVQATYPILLARMMDLDPTFLPPPPHWELVALSIPAGTP